MSLRIIGGKHRHRQLKFLSDTATRPTKDRIREAIFSALGERVLRARVLDLYCGVGTFGLEALSRGAASATFVDQRREAINIVSENLVLLKETGVIIVSETEVALTTLAKKGEKFDLIFFDPPYSLIVGKKIINMLAQLGLVSENAIIIYESQSPLAADELANYQYREYHYGATTVQIIRK